MRIAVNARFLQARLEGIGRFTDEVLRELVAQHPDWDIHLLFDRRPPPGRFVYGPQVTPHVAGPPARHPVLFVAWFEGTLPRLLDRLKPAVFFSPDGYLSLRAPARLPQVPVFHDLAHVHFPHAIGPAARWHYGTFFPRYAERAAHVLTVSEYSRQDIARTYGLPLGGITNVSNGASGQFRPLSASEKAAARNHYTNGAPYFLYVGAVQPRKNVARLLRAFDHFKAVSGLPHRLVVAGRSAWQTGEVAQTLNALAHPEAVVFTGFVPDAELVRLYSAAHAVTYVPLFEGFGLPVLEAQHAEVPILTSTTSSLPEVAGPAGLLVDPTQEAAIAEGLFQLATDDALCARLVAHGRAQRTRFSWAKTAARVGELLQKVV